MKLTITKVFENDKDKNGKAYIGKNGKPYFRVGLLTKEFGETWLNGFGSRSCKDMEGKEMELDVTDSEYNGKPQKNWKFPSKDAEILKRLTELEKDVAMIKVHLANPKTKVAGTEVDYPEPDADSIPF